MDLNESLSLGDVEQIIHLVASVGNPGVNSSLTERKRMLVAGTARLVGADVYIWSTALIAAELSGDVVTTCLVDGGWRDDQQRLAAWESLSNPEFNAAVNGPLLQATSDQRYATFRRNELVDTATWSKVSEKWETTGLNYFLLCIYPVTSRSYSAIGLHRSADKPDFSAREQAIAHVIFRQVDWLHRHGTNEPAGDASVQLSPRQRQVLVYLLAGHSRVDIAEKMSLSPHTVGDYVKAIYRNFGIKSRAELQAFFFVP